MQEIIVTANEAGQRFDKLLAKYLNEAPKSFLYKMLRKKNIVLNGKKATGNEKLVVGDQIQLYLSDETVDKFSKTEFKRTKKVLDIIYEDEHILLINKPVQPINEKTTANRGVVILLFPSTNHLRCSVNDNDGLFRAFIRFVKEFTRTLSLLLARVPLRPKSTE